MHTSTLFTYRPLQSIMVFIMMALLPPKEIQSKTLENKPGRITYRLFLEFSSAYGRIVNYFHTPFPRKTQSVINRGSLNPKTAKEAYPVIRRDRATSGSTSGRNVWSACQREQFQEDGLRIPALCFIETWTWNSHFRTNVDSMLTPVHWHSRKAESCLDETKESSSHPRILPLAAAYTKSEKCDTFQECTWKTAILYPPGVSLPGD